MLASEKMVLRSRLVIVDRELQACFDREPSNRNTAIARGLLQTRSEICAALLATGYQPCELPRSYEIAEVV